MTIKNQETLSALVDGQLAGQSLTRTIRHLTSDEQARTDFLRYQQASDLMRGYTRGIQTTPADFTQRVSAAIENEPAHQAPSRTARVLEMPRQFWKQASGFALAASMGALVVVGVMDNAAVQTGAPTNYVEAEASTGTASNRWTVTEPEVEDRLNNYLVDHNEYAGGAGMFSYGRVVSYGSE